MPDRLSGFHRHSIRLYEYDYSQPGAYFITLVTFGFKCLLGKINNNQMHLNDLGEIVQKCWLEIPDHFPGINVEPFMVMPNHFHGIITITDDDRRGTIYRAPTTEKFSRPVAGSIPTIIRTYKAAVSRQSKRQLGMSRIWQRNYYEHIIRNQTEMNDIARYIRANPSHWTDDKEHIP